MALTKAQEMVAENLRNGSIQAFAEGKEVERENRVRSGLWHPHLIDEAFLPDQDRYRVKRTPREWWEVRYADSTPLSVLQFTSERDARNFAPNNRIRVWPAPMVVHVTEVLE